MLFNIAGIPSDEVEMFRMYLELQGHTCGEEGIRIFVHKVENSELKVEYRDGVLDLYGMEKVHFYRALHIFLQNIGKGSSAFTCREKINFKETGLMIDLSRNGVLRTDVMEEFIYFCAACGMNQIYLYMEDVYEVPQDPYFGAFRGRYKFEELKKMDETGRKAGVELIPCIQTLAHLHTYLRWPKAFSLRDTEDILLAGSEKTREFVRNMVRSASAPFSTDKIHVGMDEAAMLGLGKYLHENGYQERYGIMTDHLKMVLDICEEENLHPMMWSDMFFRLKSPTGDYYNVDESTEFNLEGRIPEDLELVYWDYYHHEKNEYDKNIRLHQKITDQIRYAGGGWTWNGLAPNYRKAEKTLAEGMRSCREQGITKVMNTFWFDNGTETPMHTLAYTALYFAQLCYEETVEREDLDKWLVQQTGFGVSDFALLDQFDSPRGVLPDNRNSYNPSKYAFYQDPFVGIFDGQIEGHSLNVYYGELAHELYLLNQEKNQDSVYGRMFRYYEVLAEILSIKAELGVNLRHAYKNGDRDELRSLVVNMKECENLTAQLKNAREELWYEECRPFGYEIIDIRFAGVAARLAGSRRRMESYLEGRVEKLEELEEPMVIYSGQEKKQDDSLCFCNLWQDIVSAGNIMGV